MRRILNTILPIVLPFIGMCWSFFILSMKCWQHAFLNSAMLTGLQSCASCFSLPARAPATASRSPGAATATTTASTTPTKRTVRRSPAPGPSSSATTGSSASTSRTSATESRIVKTDPMSSDVHPLLPTSAPTSSSGQLQQVISALCSSWAVESTPWDQAVVCSNLPGLGLFLISTFSPYLSLSSML